MVDLHAPTVEATSLPAARAIRSGAPWRRRMNVSLAVGLALFALILMLAVFAPLIAWNGPNRSFDGLSLARPGGYFIFGTDSVGRDVFARVLYGGRLSLSVAFPSVALALAIGMALGVIAGYLGRRTDAIIMRVLDVFFAFPALLLAMLIVTILGSSVRNLILTIGVISAPRMARIVRAPTIAAKEREFVEAARTVGCSSFTIVRRHILPNIASPIIVEVSIALGQVILTETALSFLGLGPPPPNPTWGSMVSQNRQFMEFAPWTILAPGLAIVLTTASFLLIGHGFRIALDPRQQRR
jgi:peptide/nickel transport system permease protein